jgi:N utilization substance protein B
MQARRLALLALFEAEFGASSADEALRRLAHDRGSEVEVRDHARRIVDGVAAERAAIDARIAVLAPAIPVAELGNVERAILRSAIWEVLYSAATPAGETINDAVSLARIYAGDAARRLVNGVLGSVSRSSGGGDRKA